MRALLIFNEVYGGGGHVGNRGEEHTSIPCTSSSKRCVAQSVEATRKETRTILRRPRSLYLRKGIRKSKRASQRLNIGITEFLKRASPTPLRDRANQCRKAETARLSYVSPRAIPASWLCPLGHRTTHTSIPYLPFCLLKQSLYPLRFPPADPRQWRLPSNSIPSSYVRSHR